MPVLLYRNKVSQFIFVFVVFKVISNSGSLGLERLLVGSTCTYVASALNVYHLYLDVGVMFALRTVMKGSTFFCADQTLCKANAYMCIVLS